MSECRARGTASHAKNAHDIAQTRLIAHPSLAHLQVVERIAHVALARKEQRLDARVVVRDFLRRNHLQQAVRDLLV